MHYIAAQNKIFLLTEAGERKTMQISFSGNQKISDNKSPIRSGEKIVTPSPLKNGGKAHSKIGGNRYAPFLSVRLEIR
jgi:hypothetical protein